MLALKQRYWSKFMCNHLSYFKRNILGHNKYLKHNQKQQLDKFVSHILFLTMSNTKNFLQLLKIIFQIKSTIII